MVKNIAANWLFTIEIKNEFDQRMEWLHVMKQPVHWFQEMRLNRCWDILKSGGFY